MPSCSKGNPHDNIGSQWTQVTHSKSAASRRKRMIVGNNKESTIKGVRKLAYLHVCRVDLGTSAMDLQDSLKFDFPEVQCESIQPKYPNLYLSFKVTIFEENFKKAMNPNVWPDGACISRFFQKRSTMTSVT